MPGSHNTSERRELKTVVSWRIIGAGAAVAATEVVPPRGAVPSPPVG